MSAVDNLEAGSQQGGDASRERVSLAWDDAIAHRPLGAGVEAEPVVLDWFGQGEADLLVSVGADLADRVAWVYRSRGSAGGSMPRYDAGAVVESLGGLRCLCPVPNGASSRFDLVAVGTMGLVWLANQGESNQPALGPAQPLGIPADLGRPSCRLAQMVAVDWDGDGLTDLLVGLDDLQGYWPDQPRVPVAQQVGFNQSGGHPGYDRGGHWRGRLPQGRIVWLRNIGRAGQPAFQVEEDLGSDVGRLELAPQPAPLAVAWAGQGAWEMLVSDARGDVRLYRNFGGQLPPVLMEPRPIRCGREPLKLPGERTVLVAADLDGDRRAELVYGTAGGEVFAIHAGNRRDEAAPPVLLEQEPGELWLGGNTVVAAGDLDGDDDLDLVAGDAAGRLWLYRDQGRGHEHRYARPDPVEALGEPFVMDPGLEGVLEGPVARRLGYACPALVDWVGHGRLDLLIGGASGELVYLRNNGTRSEPRFDAPRLLRCQGQTLVLPPRVRPAAGAWHGEELDLIALDLQGFLCVYPRAGATEVAPPRPLVDRLGRRMRLDGGFGLAGHCSLWAGPWTSPDSLDLLVGLSRQARFVIPSLTGAAALRLDHLPTVLLLENQGKHGLVPRPVYHADGQPLVIGSQGCAPAGVDGTGTGRLDLLVSSDDGRLHYFQREQLRW